MLNLRKPGSAIAFSFVVVLMPSVGCTKRAFLVEIPHGFTGYVHIFCEPTVGFPAEPVHVSLFGGADAKSRPGGNAYVTVLRDGKTATAINVSWERTDDGAPVGLSFNVK